MRIELLKTIEAPKGCYINYVNPDTGVLNMVATRTWRVWCIHATRAGQRQYISEPSTSNKYPNSMMLHFDSIIYPYVPTTLFD